MGYTASDLLGVGVGFLLFGLFAFAPGYTFGWLSNVFDFRRRRLATRLASAVPLSIGLTPITAYFLWRWSLPLVWIVFGACGVTCVALLSRDARALRLRLSRPGWMVVAIAAGWVIAGTLSLVDMQLGNRLYFPLSAHDLSTHAAFTAALARDGVPPHNPYFFAGLPAPLRYHYFWFIPSGLVDRLGGALVSARIAVICGILWCGLGLMAIVALFLRFFQQRGGDQIERRALIGVSLLGVTGLDILPVILIDISGHGVLPSAEWWNLSGAIASWVNTSLWAPHDLASLVAGLTGFLLAWDAACQKEQRRVIIGLVAGGFAFASAVGSSIYVGGTLAAGCALWLAIALLKRWWRHAWVLALAGMLAGLLLLPFILQVMHGVGGANSAAPSAFPFSLTVRPFTIADTLAKNASPAKLLLLNAIFLPLNYFLELGFFFIVACLGIRRIWRQGFRDQAEWSAVALGAASLLVCTFMRSSVISYNDLGWRSPLVVQFILLLWAVEMWNDGTLGLGLSSAELAVRQPEVSPRLIVGMLVLGALGCCYELCFHRIYPVLSDMYNGQRYGWMAMDHQLGRRTYQLRRAYEELNRMLPASAVVQAAPDPGIGNVPAEMYSGRQMVADAGSCATVFGGSKPFCDNVILPRLLPLFDDRKPVTAADAERVCRQFGITALLFKDTDPVWEDKSSWIWKMQPMISNDFVRVVRCGGAGEEQGGGKASDGKEAKNAQF